MIDPQSLGALAGTRERLLQLIETLPARDCNRRFDSDLPSPGWLLGRAVFLELHLLRDRVLGEADLAGRVRHLFSEAVPTADIDAQLPPQEHLLSWAREIFDHHLTALANPGQIPQQHPWLTDSWLVWHLAQREALIYEQLLAVLTARGIQRDAGDHVVTVPLSAQLPNADAARIEQGHYRIGARDGTALDNERPAQVVELNAYRINRRPVCNAEYLAFIEAGGYRHPAYWDEDGRHWLESMGVQAPWQWRRDVAGQWYEIGQNGAMDLHPEAVLSGICAHEARAFAAWAAVHGEGLSGAVPQHEYQWEVAARMGELSLTGRAWEWCTNPYHAYPDHPSSDDPLLDPCPIHEHTVTLRGGSLHTQPSLRRTTVRRCALPGTRQLFAGTRLVMPPGKAAWED